MSESIGEYPTQYVGKTSLPDGTLVMIRPIRASDAPGLQAGFKRLSPDSVYLRFLEPYRELSDRQAKELASVDYQQRMALVAEINEDGHDNLIGVARYAKVGEHEPGTAECAIVVVDQYQRQGLGTALLERLIAYACEHGVNTFLATIHHSNHQIMRFVKKSGFPYERKMIEPGIFEVRVRFMSPQS